MMPEVIVFYDGTWHRATGVASATDIPRNPANILSISTGPHSAGDAVRATAVGQVDIVMVANNNMRELGIRTKPIPHPAVLTLSCTEGSSLVKVNTSSSRTNTKDHLLPVLNIPRARRCITTERSTLRRETFTADATNISLSGGAGNEFRFLGPCRLPQVL